jgi:hypothetical protein
VQERACLRDRDGLYDDVISPISALPGEKTTPAQPGGHGMSGKDGTLAVRVGMKKDIKSNMKRHVAGFSTSN